MAINKKLIHFNKKSDFESEVAKGNILNYSICFIADTKEIYTHGNYYSQVSEAPTDGQKYIRVDGAWYVLSTSSSSTDGLMSSSDKTKLDGIESGAQKNTVLGVKGNSESSYRTGNINITKANIGLGNVDNTSDASKPISTAQQTALDKKVDKTITVNGHALSTNVTVSKSDVGLGNVDNTSDVNKPISTATQTALDDKVDKVSGKGLSTNDYTTNEKTKLAGIESGANKTVIDSALSSTSTNPVQNKIVKTSIDEINTKISWKTIE